VRLPPPPRRVEARLQLRAEIRRGEAVTEFKERKKVADVRPCLILWAEDERGVEVPLVRWPTTVGGWKKQIVGDDPDDIGWRYKESPTGQFWWTEVVVAPAWYPPPTTPSGEVNDDAIGPGYRSAYGMVMMPHITNDGNDSYVRTHGSSSYTSILLGTSHGCHRLYNHLAIRLTSFILRHHKHTYTGAIDDDYDHHGVHRKTRGWRYEIRPSIPVVVHDTPSDGETIMNDSYLGG
jgi:hypothetical protein